MSTVEPSLGPSPEPSPVVPVTPAAPVGAEPQRGLDDLYDIGRLAARLGVEHATIRVWLSRKVPWLPAPDGRLNGGAVWRATSLEGIETRRTPGRPGRKPRAATLADLPSATPPLPDISLAEVPPAPFRSTPVEPPTPAAVPAPAPAGRPADAAQVAVAAP